MSVTKHCSGDSNLHALVEEIVPHQKKIGSQIESQLNI